MSAIASRAARALDDAVHSPKKRERVREAAAAYMHSTPSTGHRFSCQDVSDIAACTLLRVEPDRSPPRRPEYPAPPVGVDVARALPPSFPDLHDYCIDTLPICPGRLALVFRLWQYMFFPTVFVSIQSAKSVWFFLDFDMFCGPRLAGPRSIEHAALRDLFDKLNHHFPLDHFCNRLALLLPHYVLPEAGNFTPPRMSFHKLDLEAVGGDQYTTKRCWSTRMKIRTESAGSAFSIY